MQLKPIAHIHSALPAKFGVPRQSGLADSLEARIVFEPAYAVPEALRGLEGFSHIWVIWGFSKVHQKGWSPTVRPPRLGGETRVGVFASRSPYRPNGLGLSSLRLLGIERDKGALCLRVAGADMVDGTPVYDIKPYLRYTDSHPDAVDGYAGRQPFERLSVNFPDHLLALLPAPHREAARELLSLDPRPAYQDDPDRVYGFTLGEQDIRFRIQDGLCQVVAVVPLASHRTDPRCGIMGEGKEAQDGKAEGD